MQKELKFKTYNGIFLVIIVLMISRKGSYFDIFRALKGYENDQGLEPWIKSPKAHEELKISCLILPKKKKKKKEEYFTQSSQ